MTQGQSGGGKKCGTTTSRATLNSLSIFTIIRSAAGWHAARKIGRGPAPPIGLARRTSSSRRTEPFPWCGHDLNHRLSRHASASALLVPSSGTQTTTEYDDQGEPYQATVSVIDQGSGQITSTQTTNDWYDGRGDVIETLSPNGLATKSQYDGAGRLVLAGRHEWRRGHVLRRCREPERQRRFQPDAVRLRRRREHDRDDPKDPPRGRFFGRHRGPGRRYDRAPGAGDLRHELFRRGGAGHRRRGSGHQRRRLLHPAGRRAHPFGHGAGDGHRLQRRRPGRHGDRSAGRQHPDRLRHARRSDGRHQCRRVNHLVYLRRRGQHAEPDRPRRGTPRPGSTSTTSPCKRPRRWARATRPTTSWATW